MDIEITVGLIVFAAGLVYGLSGFGFGLVSVPLLTRVIGVRATPPLLSSIFVVMVLFFSINYWKALDRELGLRLAVTSSVMIPFGVFASQHWNETWIRVSVGLMILSYAIYGLLNLRLPPLTSRWWVYPFSLSSGFLAGIAGVGGPPMILYGHCCGWDPDRFKINLQAVFGVNTLVTVTSHILQHNITPEIAGLWLVGLPASGLGVWLGIRLSHFLNPEMFRRGVLVLLIGLGIVMLI